LQTKLKITSASAIITILEAEFAAGRIVEMLEGLPANRYAMIRPNRKSKVLNPIHFGIVTENEWERVIAWHGHKWQQILKDKKFRRWAKRNPIPGGED
jgi:hypothetical protein